MSKLGIWVLSLICASAQPAIPIRLTTAPEEAQAAFLVRVEHWGRYVDLKRVGPSQLKGLPPPRPTEFGLTAEELAAIIPIARIFRPAFHQANTALLAARTSNSGFDAAAAARKRLIANAMAEARKTLKPATWNQLSARLAPVETVVPRP